MDCTIAVAGWRFSTENVHPLYIVRRTSYSNLSRVSSRGVADYICHISFQRDVPSKHLLDMSC